MINKLEIEIEIIIIKKKSRRLKWSVHIAYNIFHLVQIVYLTQRDFHREQSTFTKKRTVQF